MVRQWVLKYTVYGEESFTRKCKRVAMTGIVPQEYKKYCDHLEAENQMLQAENNFFKEVMRSNCSSKYQMISECSSMSVARLCRLGDVSRSGYYKWKAAQENKPTAKDDAELMSLIREIYFFLCTGKYRLMHESFEHFGQYCDDVYSHCSVIGNLQG